MDSRTLEVALGRQTPHLLNPAPEQCRLPQPSPAGGHRGRRRQESAEAGTGRQGLKAGLASSNLCPLASCLHGSFFPALFLPSDTSLPRPAHSKPFSFHPRPMAPPHPTHPHPQPGSGLKTPPCTSPHPEWGKPGHCPLQNWPLGPAWKSGAGSGAQGWAGTLHVPGSHEPWMRGEEIHGL